MITERSTMITERSDGALLARKQWTRLTRVAIYARTAIANTEVLALQESILRKYVEEKGGAVVGVYRDCGFPGTTLDRPDWERLVSDANERKFDTVITNALSRLGRGEAAITAVECLHGYSVSAEMVLQGPLVVGDLLWHLHVLVVRAMNGVRAKTTRD